MKNLSFSRSVIIVLIFIFISGGLYLKLREYFLPIAVVRIAGQEIQVEMAKTPKAWAKGLSGRENLAENRGMLFIFPQAEQRGFWMKDMQFPIDIIWIDNGQVIDIAPNVQLTAFLDSNLPVYYPRLPARAVLEVVAGFSEKWGVRIGDQIQMLTD